jgi:hypothetical protein
VNVGEKNRFHIVDRIELAQVEKNGGFKGVINFQVPQKQIIFL